jgi:hypothetical protein
MFWGVIAVLSVAMSASGGAQQYRAGTAVPASAYCAASGGCDEHIARVQLGDIDNAGGCAEYADYTALSATVLFGLEYPITVTNGVAYLADVCSIWVDWNQDWVFDDAAPELIGDVVGGGVSPPYNLTLTVPPSALAGATRMRIRIDYDNPDPDPCGTTTYGEVEDYTLMVAVGDVYGACCDVHTGECVDDTRPLDCQGLQWHYNVSCGELNPPCGDPGCCCDNPETGAPTEPHFAYRANCDGRFLSGILGGDCVGAAFTPPCGLWQPTGLLCAPANADSPSFRAAVAALLNSRVDYFDARAGTPTLEQLEPYAAVLTWFFYGYADSVAMGDVLADYVDVGGRAILGQWCFDNLAGRIMTPEYCPVTDLGWGYGEYQHDCVDCVTTLNPVGELFASYLEVITGLSPGAVGCGSFSGGGYAIAWRADRRVYYSPGQMAGAQGEMGDWAALAANMVVCTGQLCGACCNQYTGECNDQVQLAHCAGLQWRWGQQCDEVSPACGDPGCCCDTPESGVVADPHVAYRANCEGRFLAGVLGEDCAAAAFTLECGLWQPTGVLYAPSYYDNANFRATLAALLNGSPVDYFDARAGTPTLEQLQPYAAVLTWVSYDYANKIAMGDVLADYVDSNGKVILGQWTYHTSQSHWLEGRIMTAAYCPAVCSSYMIGPWTYQGDGEGCLFHGPMGEVADLSADYADLISDLQPGAVADGHWNVNAPVVAYWQNMNVFYSSGHTGTDSGSGDWAILTANMVVSRPEPGACCNITTAECVDDLLPPDCRALGAAWRAHSGYACAALEPACGNPGACCDIYSGTCVDDVLEYNCLAVGREFHGPLQCGELVPLCGDPGCCCDWPETSPHFAYRANCEWRFVAGAVPPCGDLDVNGVVDITDYNMFLDAFGACAGQPAYVSSADLDGDGCITLVDFQMWRQCYEDPGPGCTPEVFDPPCGDWYPSGLLYAPTDSDSSGFRAVVSYLINARVDYFDARAATPTLQQLRQYRAVMTWCNYPYADAELFGDRLADYADEGNRIILGQWCFPTSANYLSGRIMTPDYCPIASASGWSSGSYSGGHWDCVFSINPVDTLTSSYVDKITALSPGAHSAGTFTNGAPVAAWKRRTSCDARDVYYSPGNTGGMYSYGDWAELVANMYMCYESVMCGACCDRQTGACVDYAQWQECQLPQQQLHYYEWCADLDPPCGNQGACCDHETGTCTDGVLEYNCAATWFVGGVTCADLEQVTSFACGVGCMHRVDLRSTSYGWHGNTLDVYVNGFRQLRDLTLPTGAGPLPFTFVADTGTEIQTVFHPIGVWPYLDSYYLYDGAGLLIASDGSGAGPTGLTVSGSCEPAYGACCDELTGVCENQSTSLDCSATFYLNLQCEELAPLCGNPGACCDEPTGVCLDGVPLMACSGRFEPGATCASLSPACGE